MKESCCSVAPIKMVVSCSGASNLGQIANNTAVKMQESTVVQMTCLAALGARVNAYIKSVQEAGMVVIDGCPVACGKRTLEQNGISSFEYFDISKLLPEVVKGKTYDEVAKMSDKAFTLIMDQID